MDARHVSHATQTNVTGKEAQALFEAMFDHTPKVDLRSPADVQREKLAAINDHGYW
jgi:hypothetical protein